MAVGRDKIWRDTEFYLQSDVLQKHLLTVFSRYRAYSKRHPFTLQKAVF